MYCYSYNKQDGMIADKETFVNFTRFAVGGQAAFADGMCSDSQGRLWVAMFGGHSITCWDPVTKEQLLTVQIPGAKNITSCCFGGPDYKWMFVTTARHLASEEQLAQYTETGDLFVIKNLGAQGAPAHRFKHVAA